MSRKPNSATSTPLEEKIENTGVEVEQVETPKTENPGKETETKPEEKANKKADKKDFGDNDMVKIKCEQLAGKSAIGINPKPVEFDEKGVAEVIGIEARYFLSVPGFERA